MAKFACFAFALYLDSDSSLDLLVGALANLLQRPWRDVANLKPS
jgi:hypothetical protein